MLDANSIYNTWEKAKTIAELKGIPEFIIFTRLVELNLCEEIAQLDSIPATKIAMDILDSLKKEYGISPTDKNNS
jgi:hypothetical protein